MHRRPTGGDPDLRRSYSRSNIDFGDEDHRRQEAPIRTPTPLIRPYRTSDRDAVYDVCLRTADKGGDATGLYEDPELISNAFAGPYLHLEPDLAFVLDDGQRAVGYVIGTADTTRFASAFAREWLPLVTHRHPPPPPRPSTPDEEIRALLHHPERMVHAALADYPAHLHIDLLPQAQRAGHGRALIATLFTALRARGVARVHLGMMPENRAARAFYDRLGFRELVVPGEPRGTYLGRTTELPVRPTETSATIHTG
ncbi:GNAT family N-acetyltransferase [Actinoalloteichus hymeniacidonis]|uniref:Acetyltransferase (GNAT) family protein n=1 Tax=Actinoalloteichus hymeniacidonis TaxID=340345 RepID=A0AAC9HRE5_9PSEU|nr:GNAT family N-acetyltransferase [Actinoalloteichus hymeniacidonis]AOS63576.1 acetyltransferase (GNAT) family protein [Actinoalloteichus hymeniacidonis]MBB5908378.1 ribosomal protein S18 acetylase RimI-like enzyme [Actinoalloteichus hymeniacidonis]